MAVIELERTETVRQEIIDLLNNAEYTCAGLSRLVRCSEKEIYDHLQHIQLSQKLRIEAAKCNKCNYEFSQRKKVHKPSKCPKCKNSYIDAPLFSIEKRWQEHIR